jgi:hypothetical protein
MTFLQGEYKYHFKISPTLQQEAELSKYISKREQEIITNISAMRSFKRDGFDNPHNRIHERY